MLKLTSRKSPKTGSESQSRQDKVASWLNDNGGTVVLLCWCLPISCRSLRCFMHERRDLVAVDVAAETEASCSAPLYIQPSHVQTESSKSRPEKNSNVILFLFSSKNSRAPLSYTVTTFMVFLHHSSVSYHLSINRPTYFCSPETSSCFTRPPSS